MCDVFVLLVAVHCFIPAARLLQLLNIVHCVIITTRLLCKMNAFKSFINATLFCAQ